MKVWPFVVLMTGAIVLFGKQTGAQGAITPPAAPRAYLCFEGDGPSDITQKANEAGARGWRMISGVAHGQGSIWCFEQYQAARPAPSK